MSRAIRLLVALVWLVLAATPALAQGNITIVDEANQLDESRVRRAAQELANRGANVALYTVASGDETDFLDRLEAAGLASGGAVDPNLVGIYVSFDPRYSEIRYGDNWNEALRTNNNVDSIRASELNPGLASGNVTGGFVNALGAIDNSIANPPTAGGGTTVIGGDAVSNALPWCISVLALLFGGPVAWRAFSKRRATQQALAGARQRYDDARRRAGAAIADFGQLFNNARDKAQYDQFSYAASDVQQLARDQAGAEAAFLKAQERFKQTGDQLAAKQQPGQADYEAGAQEYDVVTTMVAEAQAQLERVAERRAELDGLRNQASGEIDQAKKALADVAERLDTLRGDFAAPGAVLGPVEAQVARAESLLAEHRAADARAAAAAASAAIAQRLQSLARFADLREGITAGRAGAENAASQGFRVERGMAAFERAEALLGQAGQALEQRGPEAADPLLDQAEAARVEGVDRGGRMPTLQRENQARLPEIEQAGQQLAGYIEQGRRTFDMVDEFAESTWSDIRGNGSEAQAAATRAQALWERAGQRNAAEQQDFLGAKQDLDAAAEQIAYARSLIDTVIQRLKDLEAARDAARQEIDAAQKDIERGWSFVRTHDPDVGAVPEEALRQAEALLGQAQAEMVRQQPDWLTLVRQAQEANRTADEALAQARSEREAMDKLREQVGRAQKLATAEVQKIVQFASLHSADISPGSNASLNALRTAVQAAYGAFQAAEQAEDEARATALRAAQARYTALEDTAEQLYRQIYAEFQQIEQYRQRVNQEAERAEREIAQAERFYQHYGAYIGKNSSGVELLGQAKQLLEGIGLVRTEAEMQRALAAAAEARQLADRAERLMREQVQARQGTHSSGGDMGDFIAGALIGSLLSGGRGHGHGSGSGWGGSWGGGGGGGGGSWGGGGSSGGSWGGGGGGGGSWGGGGSSGGGW